MTPQGKKRWAQEGLRLAVCLLIGLLLPLLLLLLVVLVVGSPYDEAWEYLAGSYLAFLECLSPASSTRFQARIIPWALLLGPYAVHQFARSVAWAVKALRPM